MTFALGGNFCLGLINVLFQYVLLYRFIAVRSVLTENTAGQGKIDMSEQYAMPKVSTIIRETGRLSNGSYYAPLNATPVKRSGLLEQVFFYFFNFVSMAIMTAIFISSIALMMFVLDSTASSTAVLTMQTQEVPSDGVEKSSSFLIEKKLVKNIDQ